MPNLSLPALTLPELVQARTAAAPDRVALRVDGGEALTAGGWLARARPVAAGLTRRGVRAGDRVGLLFAEDDWIDYAVAALGVYLAGGAVVGLSVRLGTAEIGRRLDAVRAVGLLHGPRVAVPVAVPDAVPVPVPGGRRWVEPLPRLVADTGPVPEGSSPAPGDLVEILHTSGTTGPAKAVAVTHANLTYGQDTAMDRVAGSGGVLTPVPLGTNAGHSAILAALTSGSTVHVLSRPDARSAVEAVAHLGIPVMILPAPLATAVATAVATGQLGKPLIEQLAALRTLMLGSAPVPSVVSHRLRTLLPDTAVSIGYGSTEAAPAFTQLTPQDWQAHPDSLGLPRPGAEVRILGPDDTPVGPGTIGEICLRTPAPQRGYYDRPDDRTFRDGWTRMGDLGSLDEDGYLSFFDRAADAVLTADGQQISTFRCEDALLWHPEVADAAVVGGARSASGAVELTAFVQPRVPGTILSPARLRGFLADRLAEHETPARIVSVDTLPRGPLGKVLKRQLRAGGFVSGSRSGAAPTRSR